MGDTISAWGNSDRLSTEFLSPLYWWRNLRMGSLSRHRAQQRFRKALDQRLQDTSSPTETYSAYEEAIEELIGWPSTPTNSTRQLAASQPIPTQ
jgi:hypothetical protein